MNTQTLIMFLYGRLAETDALLESTSHELNPDDSKILLGRRSMLVDLLGFAQALSEREERLGGDHENTEAQEEEENTQNFQWN